ncbi:MAG: SIMPL domain-containing protein [Melioribacteraceae bacterium]|nr:SIMPL domain-containing protein [Melioribacteraceae bacterium]
MNENKNHVVAAAIISAGLIISVIIISLVWKSARSSDQTITVTGSAKEAIVSNLGILNGTINVTSRDQKAAYSELVKMIPIVKDYLKAEGIPEEKIEFFAIDNYPVYQLNSQGYQTQNVSHYIFNQRFKLESDDVQHIKDLSLSMSELINEGININLQSPQYLFTNIDEMKIAIQAKAAENAMQRAYKIAEATGRSLGPLRSARMGVIQITPKNSTMVSDYGYNDTSSIEKEITAVVSASFSIE